MTPTPEQLAELTLIPLNNKFTRSTHRLMKDSFFLFFFIIILFLNKYSTRLIQETKSPQPKDKQDRGYICYPRLRKFLVIGRRGAEAAAAAAEPAAESIESAAEGFALGGRPTLRPVPVVVAPDEPAAVPAAVADRPAGFVLPVTVVVLEIELLEADFFKTFVGLV